MFQKGGFLEEGGMAAVRDGADIHKGSKPGGMKRTESVTSVGTGIRAATKNCGIYEGAKGIPLFNSFHICRPKPRSSGILADQEVFSQTVSPIAPAGDDFFSSLIWRVNSFRKPAHASSSGTSRRLMAPFGNIPDFSQ